MTAMPVITSVKFNDHPVRRTVLSSHGHCDVVLVHEAGFNLGKVPPSGPGQARPTGQHLNPAVRHPGGGGLSPTVAGSGPTVAPAGRRRRGSPDPGRGQPLAVPRPRPAAAAAGPGAADSPPQSES